MHSLPSPPAILPPLSALQTHSTSLPPAATLASVPAKRTSPSSSFWSTVIDTPPTPTFPANTATSTSLLTASFTSARHTDSSTPVTPAIPDAHVQLLLQSPGAPQNSNSLSPSHTRSVVLPQSQYQPRSQSQSHSQSRSLLPSRVQRQSNTPALPSPCSSSTTPETVPAVATGFGGLGGSRQDVTREQWLPDTQQTPLSPVPGASKKARSPAQQPAHPAHPAPPTHPTHPTHSTQPTDDAAPGAGDEAKPFSCPKCMARFDREGHLKVHIQAVHNKARPFPCPGCDAAFGHSSSMLRHMRTFKHFPPQKQHPTSVAPSAPAHRVDHPHQQRQPQRQPHPPLEQPSRSEERYSLAPSSVPYASPHAQAQLLVSGDYRNPQPLENPQHSQHPQQPHHQQHTGHQQYQRHPPHPQYQQHPHEQYHPQQPDNAEHRHYQQHPVSRHHVYPPVQQPSHEQQDQTRQSLQSHQSYQSRHFQQAPQSPRLRQGNPSYHHQCPLQFQEQKQATPSASCGPVNPSPTQHHDHEYPCSQFQRGRSDWYPRQHSMPIHGPGYDAIANTGNNAPAPRAVPSLHSLRRVSGAAPVGASQRAKSSSLKLGPHTSTIVKTPPGRIRLRGRGIA